MDRIITQRVAAAPPSTVQQKALVAVYHAMITSPECAGDPRCAIVSTTVFTLKRSNKVPVPMIWGALLTGYTIGGMIQWVCDFMAPSGCDIETADWPNYPIPALYTDSTDAWESAVINGDATPTAEGIFERSLNEGAGNPPINFDPTAYGLGPWGSMSEADCGIGLLLTCG